MSRPAGELIVRYIRVLPVLSLMFAGCTCSDGSEKPAAPATPTAVSAPAEAPPPAEPPPVAEPPTDAAPAAVESPTAGSVTPDAGAAAQDDARRATCERHVAALVAQNLADPAVAGLAPRVADLLTCLAVKADSQKVCDPLITTSESGQKQYSAEARDCLYGHSILHEARAHPKGTSFTFTDIEMQQCDDRKACEALREATRTGDAEKCAELGGFQSICRAFVTLDKSLCKIEGELPARKGTEGNYDESAVVEMCKTTIDSRAHLARGLQAAADSGSGKDRALARAALGQADACKELEQAAVDTCLAHLPQEPPPTSAPAAEATPPTVAPEKSPAAEGEADPAQV